MKKTLLILFLTIASITTYAQVYEGPDLTYGVKGGINFSNLQQSAAGSSGLTAMLISFHAGAFVNYKIGDYMAVQPALLFTGKGGIDKSGYSIEVPGMDPIISKTDAKITLYYLQVPLNILYYAPAGDNDFFIGGGPFFGYGIAGNVKGNQTTTAQGETISTQIDEKVSFGNNDGDIKRFDYGVTALVGYKFYTGFMISANYDFGLASAQNTGGEDSDFSVKSKTRVIGLSVGLSF